MENGTTPSHLDSQTSDAVVSAQALSNALRSADCWVVVSLLDVGAPGPANRLGAGRSDEAPFAAGSGLPTLVAFALLVKVGAPAPLRFGKLLPPRPPPLKFDAVAVDVDEVGAAHAGLVAFCGGCGPRAHVPRLPAQALRGQAAVAHPPAGRVRQAVQQRRRQRRPVRLARCQRKRGGFGEKPKPPRERPSRRFAKRKRLASRGSRLSAVPPFWAPPPPWRAPGCSFRPGGRPGPVAGRPRALAPTPAGAPTPPAWPSR
jgi:hypothetical protein